MRVNNEELKLMFGDDIDILTEIFKDFKDTYESMLGEVDSAIKNNDPKALQITAHTLKGLLATFCADDAKVIAYELEQLGGLEMVEGASEKFVKLKEETIAAVEELVTMTTTL